MMKTWSAITLILISVMLASCNGASTDDSFNLGDPTPRCEWNGTSVIRYSENTHQETFTPEEAEFGIFTDNLSDYFFADLRKMPSSVGERITGDAWWTTEDSTISRKNITFEVRKIEGDTYWLSSENLRFVARKLE